MAFSHGVLKRVL
jgi:hypothetical protein